MPTAEIMLAPGFIILEWMNLGGLGLVLALLAWVFVDSRSGRKDIYEKIDKVRSAVEKHEKECLEQRIEDAEWRGSVNTKLDLLTNSSQEDD